MKSCKAISTWLFLCCPVTRSKKRYIFDADTFYAYVGVLMLMVSMIKYGCGYFHYIACFGLQSHQAGNFFASHRYCWHFKRTEQCDGDRHHQKLQRFNLSICQICNGCTLLTYYIFQNKCPSLEKGISVCSFYLKSSSGSLEIREWQRHVPCTKCTG